MKELNIRIKDSDGRMRTTDALLDDVAAAMARVEDPTQRLRLAFKLFDSEGVGMVTMLSRGCEELMRTRVAAREMGAVMDESLVRAAERARSKLDALSRVISTQVNSAFVNLAPTIFEISKGFAIAAKWVGRIMDRFKPLDERQNLDSLRKDLHDLVDDLHRLDATGPSADGRFGLSENAFAARRAKILAEINAINDRMLQLQNEQLDSMGEFSRDWGLAWQTMGDRAKAELDKVKQAMRLEDANARALGEQQRALTDRVKAEAQARQGLLADLFPEKAAFAEYDQSMERLGALMQIGRLDAEEYRDAVERLDAQFFAAGDRVD